MRSRNDTAPSIALMPTSTSMPGHHQPKKAITPIPSARRLIVCWSGTRASVAVVMVVGIVWYDETLGYGPDNPIANNESEAGRARNRRVAFTVIDRTDALGTSQQVVSYGGGQ